jgi:hypothetical protein
MTAPLSRAATAIKTIGDKSGIRAQSFGARRPAQRSATRSRYSFA